MSLRILVVESRPAVREALEVQLARAGYEATCTVDAREAAEQIAGVRPEVCFWGLLGSEDLPRLGEIARRAPDAYWIGVADPAQLSDQRAAALELGLDELIEDPTCEPAVAMLLRRAARSCLSRRERRLLERDLQGAVGLRPIVGASPAMIELLEASEHVAGFPAHVLIRGERGTGKEGLARAIHAQSARRLGPFVRFGLRDGDPARIASELFGASGASGTPGRLVDARGGILFLDDVDALPLDCQERLLAALEAEEIASTDGAKPRRIDARVIAATSRDLRAESAAGGFQRDLLARLAGLELHVPPLRERGRDVPLLVDHFAERAARRLGKPLRGVSDEALTRLLEYGWPGNVRELENVIDRAALLAHGDQISPRDLPERLDADDPREGDLALRKARKRLEAELIRRALRRTGGNRTRAARLLEISHRALLYKLKEHGIRD